jgi:hypothetical protein
MPCRAQGTWANSPGENPLFAVDGQAHLSLQHISNLGAGMTMGVPFRLGTASWSAITSQTTPGGHPNGRVVPLPDPSDIHPAEEWRHRISPFGSANLLIHRPGFVGRKSRTKIAKRALGSALTVLNNQATSGVNAEGSVKDHPTSVFTVHIFLVTTISDLLTWSSRLLFRIVFNFPGPSQPSWPGS